MNAPVPDKPALDAAAPPLRSRSIFFKVAMPMFIAVSDQSIVAIALPSIAGALGDVEHISLIVVGYLISQTVAAPVYGRLSDSYGRRPLMLMALGIFMASSLLCIFATSLTMLVAGRILQGLGGGGLMTLSQALVADVIPPRERPRYQGYMATIGMVSTAVSPILGGVLTEFFGWRAIFLVSLPIGLLASFFFWRMPEPGKRGEKFTFDYLGLIAFASFVVCLIQLLNVVRTFDVGNLIWGAVYLAGTVLSLLLLLVVERRIPSPLLPLDLLRHPAIWRANLMVVCHGGALVSLITFIPIYLRVVHETSYTQTAVLIVPMAMGVAVGSIVCGKIIAATGRTAIVPSVGMTMVVICMTLVAAFSPRFTPPAISVVFGLMSVMMGTVVTVVQITVQTAAGPTRLGAGSASIQYSRSIGAALGTTIVAAVLFTTLTLTDSEAGRLFGEVLQRGAVVLDSLPGDRGAVIRGEFQQAFRAAFLSIAGFALVSAVMGWTLPIRRL